MLSHQQWVSLTSAVIGFGIAGSVQAYFLSRIPGQLYQSEKHIETAEEFAKLTRQDMAAVVILLGIMNGILGAIAAILIVR
jgi:hypothetical protein